MRSFAARVGGLAGMLLVAGCMEPQPPATVAAAAPPARLGRTCADNPINCPYDVNRLPPGSVAVGEAREIARRQGALPVTTARPPALVAVHIIGLAPVSGRWVLRVDVVSQAAAAINPSIACQFQNAGRRVVEMTYTAQTTVPGQIVTVEMAGPSIQQVYVDGAECRVLGPIR